MPGKSNDPKRVRITTRVSEDDLHALQDEARRQMVTVGAVVRLLIREHLRVAPPPRK
jgi:hypothetical protein